MRSIEKEIEYPAERKLIELGSWTIRLNQLLGYFPYSVKNGGLEPFKIFTLLTLWSALLIVAGGFYVYHLATNLDFYTAWVLLTRRTDYVAYAGLVTGQHAVTIFLKVSGIWYNSRNFKFWSRNCKTLTTFSALQGFRIGMGGKYSKLFEGGRRRSRIIAGTIISIVLLQYCSLVFVTTGSRSSGLDIPKIVMDNLRSVEFLIGVFLWTFLSCLHIFYYLWLEFFIGTYAACFKVIEMELRELNSALGLLPDIEDNCASIGECRIKKDRERILNHCLTSFYSIENLVKEFSKCYGGTVLIDLLMSIIVTLAYVYFSVSWVSGERYDLVVSSFPLWYGFCHKIHVLNKSASKMTSASSGIAKQLEFTCAGKGRWFDAELIAKAKLLSINLTASPVEVQPGNFCTVNNKLTTSIISALTTYLIILVQFRQSDSKEIQQAETTISPQ